MIEKDEYSEKHGHNKPKVGTTGWYFHCFDHEDLVHCEGGANNPYKIKHIESDNVLKHGINKEYARGHGFNKEPTWFHFKNKINDKQYNLTSGKEIDVEDVPDKFKQITEGIVMPLNKDLITSRFKLKDIFPNIAPNVNKTLIKHDIDPDNAEYIRKGIIPRDMRFEDGENAIVTYITTNAVDRDHEIVESKGALFDDYLKNPVVMWGHDYYSLPIGKCVSLKKDNKGIIAKTVYYNKGMGQEVFDYRKAGFPLAESIGFIPLEWKYYDENDGSDETKAGVKRRYTKWEMLEYSDVAVPSNPEALMLAVSKGLVPVKIADIDGQGRYTLLLESEDKYIHFNDTVDKNQITQVLMDFGGLLGKEDLDDFDIDEFCEKNKVEIFEKSNTSYSFPEIINEVEPDTKDTSTVTKPNGEETKTYDLNDNPSAWDILNAIQTLIEPPIHTRWYKWVVDFYPVKYPDGHVIISIEEDGINKYYQYDYTYSDGKAALSDEYTELESGYKPKKSFDDFVLFDRNPELKVGRELSAKNIRNITTAVSGMETAVTGMKTAMVALKSMLKEEDIEGGKTVSTEDTPSHSISLDELQELIGKKEVEEQPEVREINKDELRGMFKTATDEIATEKSQKINEDNLRKKGIVQI